MDADYLTQPTGPALDALADLLLDDGTFVGPDGLFLRFPRPKITTSIDSLGAAQDLADSSKRRLDTPVRKLFVRGDTDAPPPLASVYVGGRSGTVAVKLYLALLWRCAAKPYSTDKPARAWATLLDLPDPAGLGARRITSAMKSLQALNLVRVDSQRGSPSLVTVLDERGTGRAYSLPSSTYSAAKARGATIERLNQDLYFKIATPLWTNGYMQALKGPGLVMLLILLAEQGGQGKSIWISPQAFANRYAVSHKTRTEGTKELARYGLLNIDREALATNPNATVFDRVRYRNVYRLAPLAQVDQISPVTTATEVAAT